MTNPPATISDVTAKVIKAYSNIADPRLKHIFTALIKHLLRLDWQDFRLTFNQVYKN